VFSERKVENEPAIGRRAWSGSEGRGERNGGKVSLMHLGLLLGGLKKARL
jgi:hypothetical protein